MSQPEIPNNHLHHKINRYLNIKRIKSITPLHLYLINLPATSLPLSPLSFSVIRFIMATISGAGRSREPRSGGKMVRPRRTVVPRTPYDRPRFSNSGHQNPNWISRLIYSPRTIATVSVKLLSSVFGSDSSSSSSSSSGTDATSEDDINDNNDDNDVSSPEDETMHKNGASEMIKYFVNEPQATVWKSESKHAIEQLLMEETFSREECDRLINIIKSRVVDRPINADNEQLNADMLDISSKAVMEARKWLEEKKLGSNSKSKLDRGHVTEDEVGSPVDMAKSYMQTRPPWASPSMSHTEYRSSSPIGIQRFKEETLYSVGANSMSSYKLKREPPSAGSWNIQEEIRRVRSKATEEMLKNLPSSKIDWSAFAMEHKNSPTCFVADEVETGDGDKIHGCAKALDTSSNLAAGVTSSCGFPVSQMMQEGMQNEVLPNPVVSSSERNQDLEANRTIEGKGGVQDGSEEMLGSSQRFNSSEDMKTVSNSGNGAADVDRNANGTSQPCSMMGGATQGSVILALDAISASKLRDKNCSTAKEVAGAGGAPTSNGFPVSGASLSAGLDREPTSRASDEKNNLVNSGRDKLTANIHLELSEASVEVLVVNENDNVATGSQDSSSIRQEGLSQDLTQPSPKRGRGGKTGSSLMEKEKGRKLGRYNRRGRGRGK